MQLTGIVGVAIAFIIPALLQVSEMGRKGGCVVAGPRHPLVCACSAQLYSGARMRALFSAVSRAVLPHAEAQLDAEAPLPSCAPSRATLLPQDDDEEEGGRRDASPAERPINAAVKGSPAGLTSHGAALSPGGGTSAAARAVARAVVALASRVSMREVVLRVPALDAALVTPYTVWATRFRLPEAMLALSTAMLVYVFLDTVLQIAGVVGT